MVCISCLVIPLVLWIFRRFIQPVVSPLLPEKVKSWFNFNMRIYGVTPPKGEGENSTQNEKEGEHFQESTTRNGCPFKPTDVQATAVAGGDKKTD